ncbi:tetratricopeptide repeat protein [Streptomyces mirabilis]|uniref:tetratricopeptide repeat protein n=1 Tax=Streptomyces mirabilis TaxID=68239 RepID=UPI0036776E86
MAFATPRRPFAYEASRYLVTTLEAHGRTEPPDQVAGLAADLGWLPLALSQAAAYLTDQALSVAEYQSLLTDRTQTLADAVPDPAGLPDDQSATVVAVWSLSIDRADGLSPTGLARPLLQLAAMLDPNGIPCTVLTSPSALALLAETPLASCREPQATQVAVTERLVTRALRVLHRLSLIDHTPDTPHQAVRVHALVQRVTRDTLAPTRYHHYARAAADALLAAWPDIERDTALAQALRANTIALTHHAEPALHQPDAHLELFRAGNSFGEAGQVAAAFTYFHQLTNSTRHHLGPDHPHTLDARADLARWRAEAGDPTGAATALEALLTDRLRVLGPDHVGTLIVRHNLARYRGDAGDPAGAAAALEDVLAGEVRVLGPNHPSTLTTRRNLTYWCKRSSEGSGMPD